MRDLNFIAVFNTARLCKIGYVSSVTSKYLDIPIPACYISNMKNSGVALFHSPAMQDAKLGPAMEALNPRQRAFVDYLLAIPCAEITDAYLAAGYECKDRNVARAAAARLHHDERVIAAIKEECERRLGTEGLAAATRSLLDIAKDPSHKDNAKVSLSIAAISGISPITKSVSEHKHVLDVGEQFKANCALLGLDPDALLGMKDVTPVLIEHTPDAEKLLAEAGVIL